MSNNQPVAERQPLFDLPRLFEGCGLNNPAPVIVAVSGGSDSLALLLLLHEFLAAGYNSDRLVAVTVDHGLRADSAQEAGWVGAFCAQRQIKHLTMCWSGVKPVSGVSSAARRARYQLLAKVARDNGSTVVVTGHTRDDQAETVLMRSMRAGSGIAPRGLAGMAPATLHSGTVWIVRPLLNCPREHLRDYLTKAGIAWLEDPSNTHRRFERVRVRQVLQNSGAGFSDRLIKRSLGASLSRQDLAREAAQLINRHAVQVAQGLLVLEAGFLNGSLETRHASIYALQTLLSVAGGSRYLPSHTRSALLYERLQAGTVRLGLSGTIADHRSGKLYLYRERRTGSQGLEMVPIGAGLIWDRRYRVIPDGPAGGLLIGPCDMNQYAGSFRCETELPQDIAFNVLSATPSLWRGPSCLGPLKTGWQTRVGMEFSVEPVLPPWHEMLPSFDLPLAQAVADLLGLDRNAFASP